jgi:pyruvate formate lyase activating enzyme
MAASLQAAEPQGVRCLACARRCVVHDGGVGYCTAVGSSGGRLQSLAFGVVGEASVTPIENRPVFHYRPGTRVLSVGGLGCQLRCRFCQNWEVAFRDARGGGGLREPNLPPARAVELAVERGCHGIAWTFNEPSISPMYTLEVGRLARRAGLYTVFVTNGLMTPEALDLLGPVIDVYRVDLKSLEPAFYREVARTDRIGDVVPVARQARERFGIHVEAVTNLMPGLNDGDAHLARLAGRIATELGPLTPWHLTTYVPYAHMTHVPPTPPEALARAREIGMGEGLRFVYTDGGSTSDTLCPGCGTLAVERRGPLVSVRAVTGGGGCSACGTPLGMVL